MADKKIPGIHNYCDRWCERCYFASRCAVYEDESEIPSEQKDLNNKAFWERLAENFSKARQLLEQAAKRHGVDLNTLAKDIEEVQMDNKRVRQLSKEHPISKLSWDYSEASRQWLKTQPGMMEMLEELKEGLELGTATTDTAKKHTASIKECLAIIQWYQSFIHVKFMRALSGKIEIDGWDDEHGFQHDYDGSAKIAMIGIDRSMQAWLQLFELLPDREDDFLSILGMLEKLKAMALNEFPKAMEFIRPGFDEQLSAAENDH